MSSSIAQNIEALCQEQGIERDLVIEAMKEAVRAAAKKQFRSGEDIQVDWNSETGIELSASKVVVDEVENPATELSIVEARELAGDEVIFEDRTNGRVRVPLAIITKANLEVNVEEELRRASNR